MKEVMTSNIYDIDETIIIVGTCLKSMQLKGYEYNKLTCVLDMEDNDEDIQYY